MTSRRGSAWTVACITGVLVCAVVWLAAREPSPEHLLVLMAAVLLGAVPATSGGVVARRPGTGVLGPLLVLPGLLAALTLSLVLAEDVAPEPPGADFVTVGSQGAWVLVYVVVALPLLYFPTGRLASRLARVLVPAILLAACVFMVTAATAPGPFLPPDEDRPHVFGTMPGGWQTR